MSSSHPGKQSAGCVKAVPGRRCQQQSTASQGSGVGKAINHGSRAREKGDTAACAELHLIPDGAGLLHEKEAVPVAVLT